MTNIIAAGWNAAVGVSAFVLVRFAKGRASTLVPTGKDPKKKLVTDGFAGTSQLSPRQLLGAALLTGCGALILEIVWTRQLSLVLGGSTYAFTAMLFVVLVGIALGRQSP